MPSHHSFLQSLPADVQLSLYGQPMHFLPLRFALTIYQIASPTATTIIARTIIFAISHYLETVFFLTAYSALSFLSEFIHRYTIIAAIARTAISPGTKPVPTVPSVIIVPI